MFHFVRGHHHGGHRLEAHMHGHGQRHGGGERGPKMFDAGAMRYAVLQLIAEKPRHGYDIIKELEQRAGGAYTPSPGAIYPMLAMLLDMGHVLSTPDGNKKLHSITAEGQAFLDENRQLVDAIFSRMGGAGGSEGSGHLRQYMHTLKAAVVAKAHGEGSSEARLDKIRAILRNATEEVEKLD